MPGRPQVDVSIVPIQEETVGEKTLYLFWRTASLFDDFLNRLAGFFKSWWRILLEKFRNIMPKRKVAVPVHPRIVAIGQQTENVDRLGLILPVKEQMSEGPVGAVVHTVSSSVKGGPDDPTWMRYYTNKLNPTTPGHGKFMKEIIGVYQNASEGSAWFEFFKTVETDAGSPWQIVIKEANKMKSNADQMQLAREASQTNKTIPVDHYLKSSHGLKDTPSIKPVFDRPQPAQISGENFISERFIMVRQWVSTMFSTVYKRSPGPFVIVLSRRFLFVQP